MTLPRGMEIPIQSQRGQSTLIGLILLIGMVAAGSLGIFLVSSEVLTSIEQESEQERITQSFIQMGQALDDTATNTDVSNEIDLEAGEGGAIARDETGYIRVESDGLENPINLTFGTIEYESDDGTKIAYEAGGVFRETGYETRVVSSPRINYDHSTETLSLPVITATGDDELGSGKISMKHNQTITYDESTVVENESVDITIRSEYWRGWVTFFERQAGDTVIRNIEHLNGDAAKVTVRVGHLEFDKAFERGLAYSDSWGEQGQGGSSMSEVLDPQRGSFAEIDPIIEEMVEDIRNDSYVTDVDNQGTITGGEELTAGTHFAEEIRLNDPLTANLSEGNATLVVDGDVYTEHEDLRVTNWENPNGKNHTLKIYSTGNFYVSGGEVGPERINGERSAEQLQVYGTSMMSAGLDGGSFTGLIFAPSNDFDGPNEVIGQGQCNDNQVCLHSNPEFTGSIVAASAHFQANAMDVSYDKSLEGADIDIHPEEYALPPQLTYLNIAHHEAEVRNR